MIYWLHKYIKQRQTTQLQNPENYSKFIKVLHRSVCLVFEEGKGTKAFYPC